MTPRQGRPRRDINQEDFERCMIDAKEHRVTAEEAAQQLNISRRTFFRRIKEYNETETA
jgi:transcriptional regulator of acetoin/glycerol metabolism